MTVLRKAVLRTVRLDDDVWNAVKAMDCSLNQYLRSALLDFSFETQKQAEPIKPVREFTSDPRTIPGVSVGMPPAEVETKDGFPCRCIHANCGQKFIGATRTANICENCRENGHKANPANCTECLLLQGGL